MSAVIGNPVRGSLSGHSPPFSTPERGFSTPELLWPTPEQKIFYFVLGLMKFYGTPLGIINMRSLTFILSTN